MDIEKVKAKIYRDIARSINEGRLDSELRDNTLSEFFYDQAEIIDPTGVTHPNKNCEGLIVEWANKHKNGEGMYVFSKKSPSVFNHPKNFAVPDRAVTVPVRVCDGTKPDWVDQDNTVLFLSGGCGPADSFDWSELEGARFVVLRIVEV